MQIFFCLCQHNIQIHGFNRLVGPRPDFGEGEQICQEVAHALRAFDDVRHKQRGIRVEIAMTRLYEKLGVGGDHAQRLLQVMARHKSESFEILVGAGQVFICLLKRIPRVLDLDQNLLPRQKRLPEFFIAELNACHHFVE